MHDAVQLTVNFLLCPEQPLGILAHLQSADCHAAGVDRLGRSHNHVWLFHQIAQRVVCGRHVGYLDIVADSILHDLLRAVHVDIVLHRGRHDDVRLDAPGLLLLMKLHAELIRVILYAVAAGSSHLDQIVNLLLPQDTVRIIDITVRPGQGDDFRAQFLSLAADAPGDIAEACARDGLALQGLPVMLQDILQIVDGTESGCLRPDQAAAEGEALPRKCAVLKVSLEPAVFAEHVADLLPADAHVSGGHVRIRADVAVQCLNKALAEPHDLVVRLSCRVKVRAALAAAHGQAGQAVLEGLFERKELHDARRNVLLETDSALVGPDGSVELAAVSVLRMGKPFIVLPDNAEREHPLRFHHTSEQIHLLVLRMTFYNRIQ